MTKESLSIEQLVSWILGSAGKDMWKHEPTLSNYTSATGEHELNLSFHYAVALRRWLPWLDCDIELIKQPNKHKRPDIVFHKRKSHASNFLVVEVKRERYAGDSREDLAKIRKHWFKSPLQYQLGASVVLDERNKTFSIVLISRTQPTIELLCNGSNFRFIPPPNENRRSKLIALADTLASARDKNGILTQMAQVYSQE